MTVQVRALADLAELRKRARPGFALDGGSVTLPPRKHLLPAACPSLHEDPGFWALGAQDRHRLGLMRPEERLHYGIGPYRVDAVGDAPVAEFAQEATVEDKLRSFQRSEFIPVLNLV